MVRWFGVVLLLAVASAASAEPELRGAPSELMQYLLDDRKTMTIGGEGEVRVQADKAIVALRVKNKDGSFAAALQANRTLRDKLRQRLVDARIPADSITFAKYASVPSYGWFGEKPSSYEISNEVTVAVRNEEEFVAVAAAMDAMKEVAYLGIEFQDSQKKANEAQALEAALQSARAKQRLYEKSFELALGVLRIHDTPVVIHVPRVRPVMPLAARAKDMVSSVMPEAMPVDLDDERAGGGFGTLTYRANISVEFQVLK